MITSTRQEMWKFWIHIKSSVRALLQDSKELHQRIPELKLCHEFPRNVLYLCFLPDLALIPVTAKLSLPLRMQHRGKKSWNCRGDAAAGIDSAALWTSRGAMKKIQLHFPACSGFVELQQAQTFLTPLHFKPWLSECDSKAAHGEECWKRNR